MHFLHTADWHLGRVYNELSLLEDQAHWLEQFVHVVQQTRSDAVLIAGDVYDRSVPPAEAVRLLDDTLTRIVMGEKTSVILIAGNHDGPDRLGFGSRLLSEAGLVVRGMPSVDVEPVILTDQHGEVAIYPLPYAEPAMVRQLLASEDITDHNAGLAAQMSRLRAAHLPTRRAVVVAHAFVQGGFSSESERPLEKQVVWGRMSLPTCTMLLLAICTVRSPLKGRRASSIRGRLLNIRLTRPINPKTSLWWTWMVIVRSAYNALP